MSNKNECAAIELIQNAKKASAKKASCVAIVTKASK